MSTDIRESFPTLEDDSGVGVPLTKSLEGDAAAGKVGSTAMAYKDSSGNLVLPQLDSQGRIKVSSEIQGTRVRTQNTIAGVLTGAGPVYTMNTVAAIAAVANSTYGDMKGRVNCRRSALFQLVYVDASSQVVLDEVVLDAGSYSEQIGLQMDEFDVPASAITPQFIVRAGNFDKASDLHCALSVVKF